MRRISIEPTTTPIHVIATTACCQAAIVAAETADSLTQCARCERGLRPYGVFQVCALLVFWETASAASACALLFLSPMAEKKHSHLTEEELAEFREIFNLVDLDKGGTISKDELKTLMTTLGLRPTQEELNAMVDEIDSDGNGEIDFDEFVTVMSRKVNTSYTPAQVKAAFKVFEKEAPSGFVTMAALEQALTTYGSEKLSLSDAQELLSQIEPDESGLINYVEFVNMSAQPPARSDAPVSFFFRGGAPTETL